MSISSGSSATLTSKRSCTSFSVLASVSSDTNVTARPLVPKRPARATWGGEQNRWYSAPVIKKKKKKRENSQFILCDTHWRCVSRTRVLYVTSLPSNDAFLKTPSNLQKARLINPSEYKVGVFQLMTPITTTAGKIFKKRGSAACLTCCGSPIRL